MDEGTRVGGLDATTGRPAMAVDPAGPWARFDRWAHGLLLASAGLQVLAVLLAGTLGSSGARPVVVVAIAGSVLASAALAYAVSAAVSQGRPWAREAATWLLWLFVAQGAWDAVTGLAQGRITIPVLALVSGYVLSMRPGSLPDAGPAAARTARRLGVLAIVLALLPGAVTAASTSPGSPLLATAEDLETSFTVACEGDPGAMPTAVRATFRWTWLRRDVLGSDPDTVGIGWTAPVDDEDEDEEHALRGDEGFTLREDAASHPGLVPGGWGEAIGVVDARLVGGTSWSWSVNTDDGRVPDGEVTVVLEPRAARPARAEHGFVGLEAVYAHNAAWSVAAHGACAW